MKLTATHIDNGYAYFIGENEVAIGEYTSNGFQLLENDEITTHPSGMTAFSYLRKKHFPSILDDVAFQALKFDTDKRIAELRSHRPEVLYRDDGKWRYVNGFSETR